MNRMNPISRRQGEEQDRIALCTSFLYVTIFYGVELATVISSVREREHVRYALG